MNISKKNEKMNALSFWQPYAWLIVNGYADVDSRSWSPSEDHIGKRFAVHASKRKITKAEYGEFLEMVEDCGIKKFPQSSDDFEYGAIVGSVVISEVNMNLKSYWAQPGCYHWNLKSAKKSTPSPSSAGEAGFPSNFSLTATDAEGFIHSCSGNSFHLYFRKFKSVRDNPV